MDYDYQHNHDDNHKLVDDYDAVGQRLQDKDARNKQAKEKLLDNRIRDSKKIMALCLRAAKEIIHVEGSANATAVALVACELMRDLWRKEGWNGTS